MSWDGDVYGPWIDDGTILGVIAQHERVAGPVLDRLPLTHGMGFLDLGCTTGWATRRAAARCGGANGYDSNRGLLEIARAAYREGHATPEGARFVEDNIQPNLEAGDRFYDVVWSVDDLVFHSFPDRRLQEISRVLVDGGRCHLFFSHFAGNQNRDIEGQLHARANCWTSEQWAAAMQNAGFLRVHHEFLDATGVVAPQAVAGGLLHVWAFT